MGSSECFVIYLLPVFYLRTEDGTYPFPFEVWCSCIADLPDVSCIFDYEDRHRTIWFSLWSFLLTTYISWPLFLGIYLTGFLFLKCSVYWNNLDIKSFSKLNISNRRSLGEALPLTETLIRSVLNQTVLQINGEELQWFQLPQAITGMKPHRSQTVTHFPEIQILQP